MTDPAKSFGQASYLASLLGEAKKGGMDIVPRTDGIAQMSEEPLTTEQWAGLENILATLTKTNGKNQERQERESLLEMKPNLDINENPNNHSGEPVFYRPHYTFPKTVAGIPYSVSDINHICNQCTYRNKCARHSEPVWQKTDISLCSRNHVRMTLSWDITDPENRKGTWRFTIEPKYDRFDYPERERRKHEDADAAKCDNRELSDGCHPMEPKWRIAELAKRIIEDYNDDQKDKVRRSLLSPKGRKYFVKEKDWGRKDPFTPAEGSSTRTAWEYKIADGSRVERELGVMLQAWYKAQLGKSGTGYDRSSEHAKEVWKAKLEAARIKREVAKNAEGVLEAVEENEKDEEEEPEEDETTAVSKKTLLRPLPAGKNKATTISKKTKTNPPADQNNSANTEEHKPPLKKLTQKKSPSKTSKPTSKAEKRKTPSDQQDRQSPPKKARSKYKSADIIVDSDEEADYELPTAPRLELPKQREGWKLGERLSTKVKQAIQVMQTDKVLETSADVVVEQGTTIVKKVQKAEQNKVFETEEDSSLASSQMTSPLAPLAVKEVEEKIPTPPTSPSNLESVARLQKRKAPLNEPGDEEDGVVAKKVKKVRFLAEIMSPVEGSRKMSALVLESGDVEEYGDDDGLFEDGDGEY